MCNLIDEKTAAGIRAMLTAEHNFTPEVGLEFFPDRLLNAVFIGDPRTYQEGAAEARSRCDSSQRQIAAWGAKTDRLPWETGPIFIA